MIRNRAQAHRVVELLGACLQVGLHRCRGLADLLLELLALLDVLLLRLLALLHLGLLLAVLGQLDCALAGNLKGLHRLAQVVMPGE